MKSDQEFLLALHLEVCVPLRVADYRARGGPLDSDLERVRSYVVPSANAADEMGRHSLHCLGAESILFRTEKGKSAEWVTKLVDALAVLSFAPGGVRFAGLHFESLPCVTGAGYGR